MKPFSNTLKALTFSLIWLASGAYGLEKADSGATAKMVLVIDDIGYNLPLGKRAAELPGNITYGVIPHTPLAKQIARYAMSQSDTKEIVVHMPMQALNNDKLGDGGLTRDQDQLEFITTLRAGLENVPFAVGLSNHMGSELTQLDEPMEWLMSELQLQGYFFLDSITSISSATVRAADALKVPYLRRDIFLDHHTDAQAIANAFEKAKRQAKAKGLVVVIAHPYPETLTFLERELPQLASINIELIPASQAVNKQRNQTLKSDSKAIANYR